MREKVELPAVHDRDLRSILERFGLADILDEGMLCCSSCDRQLTWGNIGALLVRNNTLQLYCNLSDCIEDATKQQRS